MQTYLQYNVLKRKYPLIQRSFKSSAEDKWAILDTIAVAPNAKKIYLASFEYSSIVCRRKVIYAVMNIVFA
jgi:hypothetical protein